MAREEKDTTLVDWAVGNLFNENTLLSGDGQPVSDRLCLMINERVTISCMVSDLEKDKVLRTNRAFDCLSRLYQRSI